VGQDAPDAAFLQGHKPKPHEHGVLTRTSDSCIWCHAALPAQAAEYYVEQLDRLTSMAGGDTPVLVEQVEFGRVVRTETLRVDWAAGNG
jgi:hypothetical protein